jgi:2-dehydro-3-deoxygalactonokinase
MPDTAPPDRAPPERIAPDWIAVDWGTSRLRAWAMTAGGAAISAVASEDGMGRLAPEGFEPALLRLVAPWLRAGHATPVVVCGMAGARQGWAEAGYRAVPCPPAGPGAVTVTTADPRLAVRILPGLSQTRPAPDVMRGEETQIAGLFARIPDFDGTACLPGSHSKWAQLSAGEVVSFQTYLSGELFAALAGHSVLRHSVAATGWDEAAFAEAVSDAIAHPARFAQRLFGLRAEALLAGLSPETARARLSGLVIGLELAAARPYWLGARVALVAEGGTGRAYVAALALQGAAVETFPTEELTLAGLTAAYRQTGAPA